MAAANRPAEDGRDECLPAQAYRGRSATSTRPLVRRVAPPPVLRRGGCRRDDLFPPGAGDQQRRPAAVRSCPCPSRCLPRPCVQHRPALSRRRAGGPAHGRWVQGLARRPEEHGPRMAVGPHGHRGRLDCHAFRRADRSGGRTVAHGPWRGLCDRQPRAAHRRHRPLGPGDRGAQPGIADARHADDGV